MIYKILIEKLLGKENLIENEAMTLIDGIVSGDIDEVRTGAILTALRSKGETAPEILGFIKGMRKYMISLNIDKLAVDTCGTGGDGAGTFNISSAAAIVTAATGVKVAKHGNRAVSSQSGSADFYEALGVNVFLDPDRSRRLYEKTGFAFLFAQMYHPAMKRIAPVRKNLGFKTIFNYLGPFLNPAQVERQIIGVPDEKTSNMLAEVASTLNYKHLLIFSSKNQTDELSVSCPSLIFEIKNKRIKKYLFDPKKILGINNTKGNISGRNATDNAKKFIEILTGEIGTLYETICLNAGAAIYAAGKTKSIEDGTKLAKKTIKRGEALAKLNTVIKFSNNHE